MKQFLSICPFCNHGILSREMTDEEKKNTPLDIHGSLFTAHHPKVVIEECLCKTAVPDPTDINYITVEITPERFYAVRDGGSNW